MVRDVNQFAHVEAIEESLRGQFPGFDVRVHLSAKWQGKEGFVASVMDKRLQSFVDQVVALSPAVLEFGTPQVTGDYARAYLHLHRQFGRTVVVRNPWHQGVLGQTLTRLGILVSATATEMTVCSSPVVVIRFVADRIPDVNRIIIDQFQDWYAKAFVDDGESGYGDSEIQVTGILLTRELSEQLGEISKGKAPDDPLFQGIDRREIQRLVHGPVDVGEEE